MEKESMLIIDMLNQKNLKLSSKYKKDIHSEISRLNQSIQEIEKIFISINMFRCGSSSDSEQIQNLLPKILDSFYKISERWDKYCNRLSQQEIKPQRISRHKNYSKLAQYRNSLNHEKEPTYEYGFENTKTNFFDCAMHDSPPDTHSGSYDCIIVSFKCKNKYKREKVQDLVHVIKNLITEYLQEYIESLK